MTEVLFRCTLCKFVNSLELKNISDNIKKTKYGKALLVCHTCMELDK